MPVEISDETLMAFADGVLDEPLFSQVATAVETDPVVAERLHALVEGADLAKAGFESLLEPVPRELMAGVRDSIARAERDPIWKRLFQGFDMRVPGVAFASLAIALVVLPMGYMIGRGDPQPVGQFPQGPMIAEALQRTPSGQTADLGDDLTLTPIATFANADGNICREFETAGTAGYVAVACRISGNWQTQFAVAAGKSSTADYVPASGQAAIDAYLEAIGAGEALLDEQEVEALARE
jgi:hypothetical protein